MKVGILATVDVISPPLVVFDWGALCGMTKGSHLPEDISILLADTVFYEIAGSDHPVGFAHKLKGLLEYKDAASRVYVGRYWKELSERENSAPETMVQQADIIHREFTEDLRQLVGQNEADWTDRIIDVQQGDELRDYERDRKHFTGLCQGFADWITQRQPEELKRMRGNPSEQHKWIRAQQLTAWVLETNPGRFDGPEWQDALSVFPDRLAVGRWTRILFWYGLMRAINPAGNYHKFENNWDDAHYPFLASYTGRIAAASPGLIRPSWPRAGRFRACCSGSADRCQTVSGGG